MSTFGYKTRRILPLFLSLLLPLSHQWPEMKSWLCPRNYGAFLHHGLSLTQQFLWQCRMGSLPNGKRLNALEWSKLVILYCWFVGSVYAPDMGFGSLRCVFNSLMHSLSRNSKADRISPSIPLQSWNVLSSCSKVSQPENKQWAK